MEEDKRNCSDISSWLLEHYHNEGENSLNCMITEDEAWIHHYDPDSKHQCALEAPSISFREI
jgi:hypothetical protein